MRARRRHEVDLFNFSFLDILACVIGLLIFILTIVVVSGSMRTNRQTDARLSNAAQKLQQATTTAQLSQVRRTLAEQVLTRRAHELTNPQGEANAVRAEIQDFDDEKMGLDTATAASSTKLQGLQKALDEIKLDQPTDSSLASIQQQLRQLDEQTADLVTRAVQQRQRMKATVEHVNYYIPHIREVLRATRWVEVSGDRIWCINSNDYDATQVDADSVEYTRRLDATGTSISALVANQIEPPSVLANDRPNETVLEVALHADGYEAFRKLRQWAWQKGFSVNWEPQAGNSIVLTRTKHAFEQ